MTIYVYKTPYRSASPSPHPFPNAELSQPPSIGPSPSDLCRLATWTSLQGSQDILVSQQPSTEEQREKSGKREREIATPPPTTSTHR